MRLRAPPPLLSREGRNLLPQVLRDSASRYLLDKAIYSSTSMQAPPASADSAEVSCNRIRVDRGPWGGLPEACGVSFPGLVPAHSPLCKGAIVVFTDFSEQSFICVGNFHFCYPSSTLCVCVCLGLFCFWFFLEQIKNKQRHKKRSFSLLLFIWGFGLFCFFFNCWERFV